MPPVQQLFDSVLKRSFPSVFVDEKPEIYTRGTIRHAEVLTNSPSSCEDCKASGYDVELIEIADVTDVGILRSHDLFAYPDWDYHIKCRMCWGKVD